MEKQQELWYKKLHNTLLHIVIAGNVLSVVFSLVLKSIPPKTAPDSLHFTFYLTEHRRSWSVAAEFVLS